MPGQIKHTNIPVMPAEALVAVTVEVFGLAPVVVEEVADDAGVFAGVLEGVFEGVAAVDDDEEEEVAAAEVGFSVVPSFPTCGVAGGVWFR